MKQILHFLFFFVFAAQLSAQTMLDPIAHPKFQTPITFPTKINLSTVGTNVFEMAATTQSLGLVDPTTNTPLTTNVWGYGPVGAPSYPGPTLVANSGVPVNVEWRNNLPATHLLPLDSTYHRAMATSSIPTVVHLHGGHSEDLSDGQPEAWYTAGYAQKGIQWTKPVYTYDNTQEGANLWYHDHALGMTRLNVYAGLAGSYRLNDANDLALSLPRGNYDRELMVQDRMFTATGQLFLPTDPAVTNGGMPEFFGDFILVNGMVWPFMNVEARKYRFRLVNGSDSRVYVFSLSNNASFLQIGSDGGKFNNPKSLTQLTLAPGERADLIIDFSTMSGQQITLINSGADTPFGNAASVPVSPTSPTGQIMQFRVNQPLTASIPDVAITTATNLRPQLGVLPTLAAPNKTRQVALFEGADDLGRILPMLGIVDPTNHHNGSDLWHDHTTEIVNLNDTETWEVYNTTADAHPIHLHLVSFQILSKQTFTGTLTDKPQIMHTGGIGVGKILSNIALTGAPTTYAPNDLGWKDTHILLPGEMMKIKARFDRAGEYVWHCHILSHEDHDMMRKLIVSNNVPCVGDATPPVLTACPANIALTTTGTTAIAPHWIEPTATDNCSTPSVSFTTSPTAGLMHGGAFPIGTTTVSYMAMDANNNMSTCGFNVVVTQQAVNPCTNDATPPVLMACPVNIALTTTGTTAVATWTAPTAMDNCSTPSVAFTTSPTANLTNGGAFPIGTTTVTYKATDAKNNATTCFFTVVVTNPCATDAIPPVLTACPANQSLTTTGTTAYAAWNAPTATDNCSTPSVAFTTSPSAYLINGGTFPIGTTTVTYKATDAKNNATTCSFTVVVTNPCATDAIPPVLTACPANQNLTTTGSTAVASWTAPTATDNCSTPSVSFTTSPTTGLTNGGAFPIGTTTVTYMAMDAKNNMSTCRFNIAVTNICATSAIDQYISVDNGSFVKTNTVTVCSGQTIKLDFAGAFPTTWKFVYTRPDGTSFAGGTNGVDNDQIQFQVATSGANLINKGTWKVTYTNPNGCSNTASFIVDALAQPVIDQYISVDNGGFVKTNTVTVCSGQTVKLDLNGAFPTTWKIFYTRPDGTTFAGGTNGVDNDQIQFQVATSGVNLINKGTWKVTYTNPNGCSNTASFILNCANDVTPPVFTSCPTNQSVSMGLLTLCKPAYWSYPTAADNCGGFVSVIQTAGLTSGWCFLPGTYKVTFTATDLSGNKGYCNFSVNAYKTLSLFLKDKETIAIDAIPESHKVLLDWVTNTGSKNDYYTVEKLNKTTGQFEPLATVNNVTTDDAPTHYNAYDEAPEIGDNTYHVKVTYQDGTSKISDNKTVNFKGLSGIVVYPNPANDVLSIDLAAYKNQAVEVYLYNYLGQQEVFKAIEKVDNTVVTLDVATMQTGNYTVRVKLKNSHDAVKAVVITH